MQAFGVTIKGSHVLVGLAAVVSIVVIAFIMKPQQPLIGNVTANGERGTAIGLNTAPLPGAGAQAKPLAAENPKVTP